MASASNSSYTYGRLPYELWLRCMHFAVKGSADGPLPFLCLSRGWAESIIAAPELWTTVVINGGADEVARISVFLHLSRSHLLDIVLDSRISCGMELVMPHAQRIQSLREQGILRLTREEVDDVVERLVKGTSLYPQLTTISIKTRARRDQLLSVCPNLQTLGGMELSTDQILSSRLQHASSRIDSIQSHDNVLKILSKDDLRSLKLRYSPFVTTDSFWSKQAQKLKHLIFGNLQCLELEVDLGYLILLPSLIPSLPQARTLTLLLRAHQSRQRDWTLPTLLAEDMGHIDDLSITLRDNSISWREWYTEQIIHMFTANKPLDHLKSITFISRWKIEIGDFYSLLSSVTCVRSLDIRLGKVEDKISPRFRTLTFPRAFYVSLTPSILFNYLEAPNAIHVEIWPKYSKLFHSSMASTSLLTADGDQFDLLNNGLLIHEISLHWPSLQKVRIVDDKLCTTLVHVNSLSHVHFDGFLSGNNFIRDLLRNPEACPQLQTIRLDAYPIWELLFAMLRERNKRALPIIKQISLCGYPVAPILSKLVKLLRGESDVYTTRSIDEVIYRRFKGGEQRFAACKFCALSGYIACYAEEGDVVETELLLGDGDDLTSLAFLGLGDHEPPFRSHFYARWEDATSQELSLDWLRGSRMTLYSCSRHSRINHTDITRYTLDGILNP